MNEQEKLERLMEYSRQLAQQNASNQNSSETSSSPSAIKLDISGFSRSSDDLSFNSTSSPDSAPEISMPNLTADWDSIWNSGSLNNNKQNASESDRASSSGFNSTSRQTQYSSASSSRSDSAQPSRRSGSSTDKSETSNVDDDQYNWTRTRSTLRAAKDAVESYEHSLSHPNDFSSDKDSGYLKPIDEIMKQNAEDEPSEASSGGKSVRFTANDFIGTDRSGKQSGENTQSSSRISGTMRPSNAKSASGLNSRNEEPPQRVQQEPSKEDARQRGRVSPQQERDESSSANSGSRNASNAEKMERLLPSQRIIASVKHLHKSFTRGGITVPVLQDLSLDIVRGEFTAIIGQSGSGKSTLLNAIGLLSNIDAGEIIYENRRIDNLFAWQKDEMRNLDFGLVFQFYHLLPEFTMLENILMPMMVRYSTLDWFFQKRECLLRAMELIHKVGLEHRVNHKPRELSGGEMQRAAIARALITSPKLLLADEPTGNLDQKTGREILELLYSLQREEKLTILMVTHDPLIARQADRTYQLSEGKLL